jgi:hypothetical protein
VIRRAPEHYAVDVREMVLNLRPRRDPAVDDDLELGELFLEPVHEVVVERGDLAIFLGR